MKKTKARDIEKTYTKSEFIKKLRRFADSIGSQGRSLGRKWVARTVLAKPQTALGGKVILPLINSNIRIAGIIIQDNKLLMLLGKGYSELWTPGGKIEVGESDEECLQRELKEEIGVELTESKFFKKYNTVSFYNPEKGLIERVYIVKIQGEIKPDAEIESFIWFTKEDYERKKFPMITHTEKDLIPDLIREGIW